MGALRELSLFTGAGGGLLGSKLLGWRTVCCVERDSYCQRVLSARMADGVLDDCPIWDDVSTFDAKPWRGLVDVVSGGFPCQDISLAGRGDGLDGSRSGLWYEMARVVREAQPRYVFVENVPALTGRGLDRVLRDLAQMGYDAWWCVLGAAQLGAPHQRDRMWIRAELAHTYRHRQPQQEGGEQQERGWLGDSSQALLAPADADSSQRQGVGLGAISDTTQEPKPACDSWWAAEPEVGRVADGVAHRVGQLKALGNGQVPAVAAAAWTLLGHMAYATKGR